MLRCGATFLRLSHPCKTTLAHRTNYKREHASGAEAKAAKREAKRQAKAVKVARIRNGAERDGSDDAEAQRPDFKNDGDPDPEVET